jgi:uncharacterized membrane protein YjgN (DUF898 family)
MLTHPGEVVMLGRLYDPTPPPLQRAGTGEPGVPEAGAVLAAPEPVASTSDEGHHPDASPRPSGAEPAPGEPSPLASLPFLFTGLGSEFFRIWIVNLALTVVSLGFYSPWAKVRRLEYFYGHTVLGGTSFGYHGDPMAILRGRMLAVALLVTYNLLTRLGTVPSIVAVVGLSLVLPWMIHRSLRFRLHNSSYRGLRFRFGGSLAGAYQVFLLTPIAAFASLGVLAPVLHWSIKRYQFDNSEFGSAEFECPVPLGPFYRTHVIAWMLAAPWALLGLLAFGAAVNAAVGEKPETPEAQAVMSMVSLGLALFSVLLVRLVIPYVKASVQNIVWNELRVGPHRFSSAVSPARFWAIAASNLVLVVCTLGLFQPFAATRLYRYQLECLTMFPGESLDGITASPEEEIGAGGEETADLFDLDFGF